MPVTEPPDRPVLRVVWPDHFTGNRYPVDRVLRPFDGTDRAVPISTLPYMCVDGNELLIEVWASLDDVKLVGRDYIICVREDGAVVVARWIRSVPLGSPIMRKGAFDPA